jgi:hypothetical protein
MEATRKPTRRHIPQGGILSGIRGEQSNPGAGLLLVLSFPLLILIPLTAPNSSSSETGTMGPILAYVPSGLSLPHPQAS